MGQVRSINTTNLKIARENTGLDTATASKKLTGSRTDVVQSFETGEKLPTWTQTERLAKIYNVSPLLFFSNKEIARYKEIPDYRVGVDKENTSSVRQLINFVISRQKWLEKKLNEDGAEENTLQGSGRNFSPEELANFIKYKLEIEFQFIKQISGNEARAKTLKYLVEKAESKGIFVGKTVSYHRIGVNDLRGLYIGNKYCPFVVINRRDAKAGQIFSFIHELAHLFRNTESISNNLDFRTTGNKSDPEEIFCNKVAAEFLLPKEDLNSNEYRESDIESLSILYKVSELTVLYRLKELKKLRVDSFDEVERRLLQKSKEAVKKAEIEQKKREGGNFVNSMKDSNGSLFNNYVSRLYTDNDIGYVEAKNVLRFSPELV